MFFLFKMLTNRLVSMPQKGSAETLLDVSSSFSAPGDDTLLSVRQQLGQEM